MRKLIILTIMIALGMLLMQPAFAQDVSVSTYVLNLGSFDVAKGTYNADFYLDFVCDSNCSPDNFEILNGKIDKIDKILDEPNEKFYRIRAEFTTKIDLQRFPFDKQRLQIIIEDKKNTIDKIRYVSAGQSSGIEDSIAFAGWNIDGWNATVREHSYSTYNETFSQYVFNIDISRISMNSFMKTFLPVFFIVLVVLFTFVIDPDKITTRITMLGSMLIAAVMFHVAIAGQIPPVGYLTFADKFMALTYVILVSSFMVTIAILQLTETKRNEIAMKLHRYTEFSMFIIVPILYAALFLFLL